MFHIDGTEIELNMESVSGSRPFVMARTLPAGAL